LKLSISIAALLLMSSLAARTEAEETDCRAIEDPNERLACFDATYGTEEKAPEAAEAATVESESVIVSEPVAPEAPVSSEPTPAAVAPATAPLVTESSGTQSSESPPPPEKKKTGFLGDELINFSSTITSILAGDKQKMVFQLENEQIWLQSSPRRLPFKEGDTVTIKNALLGGYIMRSEKGVSTRVQRIH
jgi:hypothetical protein